MAIPEELTSLMGRWVAWKYVRRPDKPKPDKVPINPRTNTQASHSNPDTWGDYDAAVALAQEFRLSGIGFMFSADDNIAGLDYDNCFVIRNGETVLLPWVEEDLKRLNSYTEYSPSGNGLHVYVRVRELPRGQRKFKGFELYEKDRYFSVTGNHYPGTPTTINERTDAVRETWAQYQQDAEAIHRIKSGPRADDYKALVDGSNLDYAGNSEADMALVNIIANACRGDAARTDRIFRQAEKRENLRNNKWDTNHFNGEHGMETYGEHTIRIVCDQIQERQTQAHDAASASGIPEDAHDFLLNAPLTDAGDAECFARVFASKYRFEGDSQRWYLRHGVVWVVDTFNEHVRDTLAIVRARGRLATTLSDQAASIALQDHARKQESTRKLMDIIKLCSKVTPFATNLSCFDTNNWLLAVENGVVDLATVSFRVARDNDLFLLQAGASYVPDAECPQWEKFIDEIFPDKEVQQYVQALLGYSLTGDVSLQILMICLGSGANGKSTLFDVVSHILKDYATTIDFASFDASKQYAGTEDTAVLHGKRFITVIESDEDKRLAEGKIKKLTGGDMLRGEFKYGHSFTFLPTHKLWFAMNRRPRVIGSDFGLWRRLKVIPFTQRFERGKGADLHLKEKLLQEKDGILNWLLAGLRYYLANGADDPPAVCDYVQEYQTASDSVRQWLEEMTIPNPENTIDADTGYYSYKSWCERSGEFRLSKPKWMERLTELGLKSTRKRRGAQGKGGFQTVFHGYQLDDHGPIF